MANGDYEIDEKTFKEMPIESQTWLIFTTFNSDRKAVDTRFKTIEHRKLTDRALSVGAGFVGGFMAVLAKKVF